MALAAVQVRHLLLRRVWPAGQWCMCFTSSSGRVCRSIHCSKAPPPTCIYTHCACSRGKDQADVKAACDDLGVALIAYSPLALGVA